MTVEMSTHAESTEGSAMPAKVVDAKTSVEESHGMKVDNIKPQVVRFVIPDVHRVFVLASMPTAEFGVRHWHPTFLVSCSSRTRCWRSLMSESPQRKQDQGFEPRSNQAATIAARAKKKVRSLHQLGRCCHLPGVDDMNFSFTGIAIPEKSECARDGVRDGEDSSATVSSSSSSDGSC